MKNKQEKLLELIEAFPICKDGKAAVTKLVEEMTGEKLEEEVEVKKGQVYKGKHTGHLYTISREGTICLKTVVRQNSPINESLYNYTLYADSLREAVIKAVNEARKDNGLSRKLGDLVADELGL